MDERHTRNRLAKLWIALVLLAAQATADVAHAEGGEDELVRVELIADVQSVAPGQPFHLGVRFEISKDWHINWINPGDAGLAPSVAWTLPDGFVAEQFEWPYPRRYVEAGPLTIFGYSDTLTLWFAVTPPDDLAPGESAALRAGVDWLACRDVYVRGSSNVEIEIPIERVARGDEARTRAFNESRSRLPEVASAWNVTARYNEHEIILEIGSLRSAPGFHPAGVFFFPTEQGIIDNGAAQRLDTLGAGFQLTVPRSRTTQKLPRRLTGVLVLEGGRGGDRPQALLVDAVLAPW
jgi:thiol:disulfide interchange protein DsbD